MNLLLAELRKIVTIRAFYFILAIIIVLPVGLMALYVYGIRDVSKAAENSMVLANVITNAAGLIATLLSFIAVLSVGHEYRYNTILYAFSSVNNRLKVVLAKLVVLLLVGLVITAMGVALAVAAFYIGQSVQGIATATQTMPSMLQYGRILLATLFTVALAFFVTFMVRSFAFAIAFVLIVPSTVEPLLTLVLKENTRYLPYTATGNAAALNTTVPYSTSVLVIVAYTVVLFAATAFLVRRRDAN